MRWLAPPTAKSGRCLKVGAAVVPASPALLLLLEPTLPTCSTLSRPWTHWYSMLVMGCRRQLLGNSKL
jgi:hypothetical protein